MGSDFEFSATKTVRNAGDTELGLYHGPALVRVSRAFAFPAGVTGSVEVGAAESNARVLIQRQGLPDQEHFPVAPGTVFTVEGAAVVTVSWRPALAVQEIRNISDGFAIECVAPGEHTLTFTGRIAAVDPHLLDPNPADNELVVDRAIECVVPLQVNIRPGNQFNSVNPGSSEIVSVAVLTTLAGECGLPSPSTRPTSCRTARAGARSRC